MTEDDVYHFSVEFEKPESDDEFEELISTHPVSSVFQSPIWFDIKANVILAILRKNGQLVAFALVEKKRILCDLVFGPIYTDIREGVLLCEHLVQHFKKNGAFFLRISPAQSCQQPFVEHILKSKHFAITELKAYKTLITDLTEQEKNLFKLISNHHKKAIKKSEVSGLTVTNSTNVEVFLKKYSDFVEYYRLAFSPLHDIDYLRIMFSKFQANGQFQMFLVQKNEEVIGGLAFLTHNRRAYYAYGFSDKSAKVPVLHYGFWEAIKFFINKGFVQLDWGGFDEQGKDKRLNNIHLFKKRFGGQVFEYQPTYVIGLNKYFRFEWVLFFKKISAKLMLK